MSQVAIITVHRRMAGTARQDGLGRNGAANETARSPAVRLTLQIDGKPVEVRMGETLLAAAAAAGIYIPALCAYPDLPMVCSTSQEGGGGNGSGGGGCGLCLVELVGVAGVHHACAVPVAAGLQVITHTASLQQARQTALAQILEHHPHVCLTCPQRDGCSRVMCCFNNTVEERCCSIMSHCALRKVADYIIIPEATPEYDPQANRLPVVRDEPFYDRDYNLCIDCRRCLVACNEVRGVGCLEVKQTNGRRWVGPVADTLMESGCKFCNACVEVCPTGALLDRTLSAVQKQGGVAPCTTACPAGIDVPRYVQLAGLGRFSEANAVVREKLPFPGILGRACYAPCESDCRRGNLDDPLSIRSLKRIAAERDDGRWRELQRRAPPTGRRLAVIGAGPAGLTAAFYLAKKGHAVTVFEAMPAAGGMARYGIPAYRLPRAVIDAEVADVAALGVTFHFDTRIDDLAILEAQGFDALFVAIGAQQAAPLEVPGAGLAGVVDGIGFLREVAQGRRTALPQCVTVIGGGDVACDVARSALRLAGEGAAVELVYRRTRAEMPAHAPEVAACLEEGVQTRFQRTPVAFRKAESVVDGADRADPGLDIDWVATRLSRPNVLGRRHLEQVPGSMTTDTTDLVIAAVGQQVAGLAGLVCTAEGRIAVDAEGRLVGGGKVFAGGDAVLGPKSLIDAVAQGRQAASAIDRFLGGDGDIDETLLDETGRGWQTDPWIGREEEFNQRRQQAVPRQPVEARRHWDEVEHCYSVADAVAEGQRCLKCNLMHDIGEAQMPPESWHPLEAVAVHALPAESGVYFLFDANKQVLAIKGVADLQAALALLLAQQGDGVPLFFSIEPAHYYSQRESELLQAYSAQHGRLPPGIGEDALDDLF